MQAELKFGSRVYRMARVSFHTRLLATIDNHLTPLSQLEARSNGHVYDLQAVGSRNEIDTPRCHSSFPPSRSCPSNQVLQKKCRLSNLSDCSLCNTRCGGRSDHSAALLTTFVFFLVSCCRVGLVLDCVIRFLQRFTHHVPCLLRFMFIRVLVKKAKDSVPGSLARMTCRSSFENQPPLSDHMLDGHAVAEEVEIISRNVFATGHASLLHSIDDDHDDYGFFADFEEDQAIDEKQLFHSFVGIRDSRINSLCILEEAEEVES